MYMPSVSKIFHPEIKYSTKFSEVIQSYSHAEPACCIESLYTNIFTRSLVCIAMITVGLIENYLSQQHSTPQHR